MAVTVFESVGMHSSYPGQRISEAILVYPRKTIIVAQGDGRASSGLPAASFRPCALCALYTVFSPGIAAGRPPVSYSSLSTSHSFTSRRHTHMKSLAIPLTLVLSGSLAANALVFPIKQTRHASTTLQRRSGRTSYARPQVLAAASSDQDDQTDLK